MNKNGAARPWLFHELDARHRIAFSAAGGAAAFFCAGKLFLATRLLVSWDVFTLALLILSWIVLATEDPYEVRRNARVQDGSLTFLFTAVISAAMVSLLAVGFLLSSAKGLPAMKLAGHVGISVATILLSWGLVHTLFAMRYAHLYYFNAREEDRDSAVGGLIFPGEESPDYLDFAYFSFVIGMTCQTSDINISAQRLRRLTLVHGLIAFCFNTAILAMFVNIVASLV